MNKLIITLFLLIFTFISTYSTFSAEKFSNTTIDSLRKELLNKTGSDKSSTQLELAFRIMDNDQNVALGLANSALNEAKLSNNKNLEMRAYYILGRINAILDKKELAEAYYDTALIFTEASGDNWLKGEILFNKGVIKHKHNQEIEALKYFNASLQACRLSNNFKVMGATYSMMGIILRVNGLYDRAIEYLVNSRLNYEKANYSEGKAWNTYLLGRIYSDLKLPQKALEYFQEALDLYTKLASNDSNNTGLAICYEQIGLLNLDSGNFSEAKKHIDRTLKIYTANKSAYGLSNAHKNLGMIEYSTGNFENAEKYLNESLKIKMEIDDYLSLPTIYEYLGLCLIGKGHIVDGVNSLKYGLTLATSNNQKKIQLNIYLKLSEVYLSINDFKNAISCQQKQIEIQDLLLSGAANIKMEQLQAIYEIDKQNGQIIELKKQNEINSLIIEQHRISRLLMIIGIIVAFLFSLSIYWFYNKIRRKNLELKESNAAKDKFFAIIAHDLRGPTGTLAAFLEHINESFNELSPAELKEILRLLYKSAEDVRVLLENLLIWAQSQLNKIEFLPTEFKLTDLIQNSLKGLNQTADNKQVDIKLELNNEISVIADPNMVQTIVRNLLSNALKFTHRGGLVTIRTEVQNMQNAIVHIIDTGVGIEKASLSKIFDGSNTLHNSGTENEKSTGLGLILVKDFIVKNRGTIAIESQKGIGTTVSFTLPLSGLEPGSAI
jgi:signal transduction histidine kinase/Tfp pilus assembly protein PilF